MPAIALFGGLLQMSLGQPDTTPRLDNVHRFLAGIYLGWGLIAGWAALTVRRQGTLIYLTDRARSGAGRLRSRSLDGNVGIPDPAALWIAYAASEFILPLILVMAHRAQSARG
jgi:hypothetical protein